MPAYHIVIRYGRFLELRIGIRIGIGIGVRSWAVVALYTALEAHPSMVD